MLGSSFVPPNPLEPLDVAPLFAKAPADRMVRGVFHAYLRDFAARQGKNVDDIAPIGAHDDIPLHTAMRLDLAFASLLYPDAPTRDALRRIGWLRIPALLSSPVARLIFNVSKWSPRLLLHAVPKASRLSGSASSIRIVDEDAHAITFAVDDYFCFRDVLFGAIDAVLPASELAIRPTTELRFDLRVAWQPEERAPVGRYAANGEIAETTSSPPAAREEPIAAPRQNTLVG